MVEAIRLLLSANDSLEYNCPLYMSYTVLKNILEDQGKTLKKSEF